ncbi:MAG TPA: NAD(P)H-hydrate dehydratase [Candidatus Eisenbacteria bacterium]|nr:NAD(P)H-hydrate dehydratase [Candidatus Eisenbacteria bacterium]
MKITTAAEMREIDRASTEKFGVPSLTLMENAGNGVAQFILENYREAERVAVVCGKGNNGGDGFVIARKLHRAGRVVEVLLLAAPAELQGDAAAMFERLPVRPIVVQTPQELQAESARSLANCGLIVDAVLGTGFKPPVKGLYADAIAAINGSGKSVVAVDIPSGAESDVMTAQAGPGIARADAIVTFTAPRPAHVFGQLTRGPVIVAPIGSPEAAIESALKLEVTTARDLGTLVAPRPMDSNKGMYGHVLIVGGSLGKSGAAAMAGMAALRAGAGLVTVATAKSALPNVAGFAAELMTEPLPETDTGGIGIASIKSGKLQQLASTMTVVAIGPGIGRHPETVEFVRTAVAALRCPVVIDADGLNAFDGKTELLDGSKRALVLTPHPGEMSRLAGISTAAVQADRLNVARTFAREHKLVLVLKGNLTVIALPDGTAWVNPTGNPGMATGGTGDILTGMTAGIVAQMPNDAARAAVAAAYLHGLAGNVAAETMGEHSLVATDLLTGLPEAFRRATRWDNESVVRVSG